jgi:hypothetical protein
LVLFLIMIDYRSKVLEILKNSNGLSFSSLEEEFLRSLSESEKREYRFEKLFTTIYELEEQGLIFKGKGGNYEKNKYYLRQKLEANV